VVVQVRDAGPGPRDPLTGLVPAPAGSAGAGLGLWLASQLPALDVVFSTDRLFPGDTGGFAVRLRAGQRP
jgi:hypothetical protein